MQTITAEPPRLCYSIKESMQATSLRKSTIYNHIAAGRLKVVRVGRRTLIPVESLRALVAGEAA